MYPKYNVVDILLIICCIDGLFTGFIDRKHNGVNHLKMKY
jgi:hypothetical protein